MFSSPLKYLEAGFVDKLNVYKRERESVCVHARTHTQNPRRKTEEKWLWHGHPLRGLLLTFSFSVFFQVNVHTLRQKPEK